MKLGSTGTGIAPVLERGGFLMRHKTWISRAVAVLALFSSASAFAEGTISPKLPLLQTRPQIKVTGQVIVHTRETVRNPLSGGLLCSLENPEGTMTYSFGNGETTKVWRSAGTCQILPEKLLDYQEIKVAESAADDFHYLEACERRKCDFIVWHYNQNEGEFVMHFGRF